jgi:retinol-binding protein 3
MRHFHGIVAAIFLTGALLRPHPSAAQEVRLDRAQRREIIDKAIALVEENYVYPDRAKGVESFVRKQVRAGAYDSEVGLDGFLDHLNHDLQTAGHDRHLRVGCDPRVVAQLRKDASDGGEIDSAYVRMLEENNYRLKRVEWLEGNVGYFKLDNFVELRFVKDALVGAMTFLQHCSAFVLDLTDNGGGAAEASRFLVSYFLPEGTVVGETWTRSPRETTRETVSRASEVKPMLDTPVVILVSERTASAAEAVAYTLQQAKRAVVVGSRTKGMANPGRIFPIDDSLFVMVPTMVQRNAVSGTNWEGAGVVPDIPASRVTTFATGMAEALNRAATRKSDPKAKYGLRFLAEAYEAQVPRPQVPPAGFQDACVGEYEGGQRIVVEGGTLRYRKGDVDRGLSYTADRTFAVEGRTDYRLKFEGEDGNVADLRVLWFDDTTEAYKKVK